MFTAIRKIHLYTAFVIASFLLMYFLTGAVMIMDDYFHRMNTKDFSEKVQIKNGRTEAETVAERMASLGMSIASTVPIGRTIMPLPMLHNKGVNVKLGTDSLTDHWSPFGIGDQLEKVGRFAELYGRIDEI